MQEALSAAWRQVTQLNMTAKAALGIAFLVIIAMAVVVIAAFLRARKLQQKYALVAKDLKNISDQQKSTVAGLEEIRELIDLKSEKFRENFRQYVEWLQEEGVPQELAGVFTQLFDQLDKFEGQVEERMKAFFDLHQSMENKVGSVNADLEAKDKKITILMANLQADIKAEIHLLFERLAERLSDKLSYLERRELAVIKSKLNACEASIQRLMLFNKEYDDGILEIEEVELPESSEDEPDDKADDAID